MTCAETADRGPHPGLGESQAWAPAQTSWRSTPPATLTAQPHCPDPPFLQLVGPAHSGARNVTVLCGVFLNQIEVLGAPTLTGPTGGQDAATRNRWSWELLSGPALGSQPCAPCLSARWISGMSAWLLLCRAWTRGWWLRRASRPQSKWTHGAVPLWEAATFSGCCKKRDMVGMCPQSHPSLVLGTVLPL